MAEGLMVITFLWGLAAGIAACALVVGMFQPSRSMRQVTVVNWCRRCFGAEETNSIPQRGIRFLEEAAEAAQAATVDREMAHKVIDHVWDKPAGDLAQELGGCEIGILALANAAGLDADRCGVQEVSRVLSRSASHFRLRNAAKNHAGLKASEGN